MKIKKGEYVRTENGIIGKFECYSRSIVFATDNIELDNYIIRSNEDDAKAHSKNIIDLIEAGDIVELINGLNKNEFIKIQYLSELDIIKSHKIISILTHEQYQQNCYKVVE